MGSKEPRPLPKADDFAGVNVRPKAASPPPPLKRACLSSTAHIVVYDVQRLIDDNTRLQSDRVRELLLEWYSRARDGKAAP